MASILKRNNSYRIRVYVGETVDGKKQFETTTWHPDATKTEKQNKKLLDAFVIDYERKVKSGMLYDGDKMTLCEFIDKWMNEYAPTHIAPTTIESYKMLISKHIIPSIGNRKLSDIKPSIINKLLYDLSINRKDGKSGGYSNNTIHRVYAILSSILSTATEWEIIEKNPCTNIKPPKKQEIEKIKHLTPEQAAIFLDAIDQEMESGMLDIKYNVFFKLCLFCGLRNGETVALTWDDVDFENKQISITKSTGVVNNANMTKMPKNQKSVRIVSVPDAIITLLKRYKLEYNSKKIGMGTYWKNTEKSDYLFIQDDGTQMYCKTPYSAMKKFIKRYNKTHSEILPNISIHGLRHTSATLLISENVDVRTVSNRLGHAQTSTTMNIYAHALQKKENECASILEQKLMKKA